MDTYEDEFEVLASADSTTVYLSVAEYVGVLLPFVDSVDSEGRWRLKPSSIMGGKQEVMLPFLTVESGGVVEWKANGENHHLELRFDVVASGRKSLVKARLVTDLDPSRLGSPNANPLFALMVNLRKELDEPVMSYGGCGSCNLCHGH